MLARFPDIHPDAPVLGISFSCGEYVKKEVPDVDRSEFGFACYRMMKILKLREDLIFTMKAVSAESAHRDDYIALSRQLDKVIESEARFLDAASKA